MDTLAFLQKILPAEGLYIIGRLIKGRFKHTVCDNLTEAATYAAQFDAQGVTTYHACAAFRERTVTVTKADGSVYQAVRLQKNVRALKALWMDLDVEAGNEKKFASQEAAVDGLVDFCTETSIPIPMIVSSGWGVHAYWPLGTEVGYDQWHLTSEALKRLAAKLALPIDPSRTADAASVLRPVGTTNRKVEGDPRPVELVHEAGPFDFAELTKVIFAECAEAGVQKPEIRLRENVVEQINEAFAIQREFPPCSGRRVAERCQQVARMRDTRGNIAEPLWYATIQLLCNATEGDGLIHDWSAGHPAYSQPETDKKIEQVRRQSLGPTLCSTFDARNPGGCENCPFKGKISSPAQLGTEVKLAAAPVITITESEGKEVQITLPHPPEPFKRGEGGGIFVEDEGILHKVYDYDLFPIELSYDEHLGFETVKLRHWLPQEGWRECSIQSSLLARPVDFEMKLRDNHIQPLIRNRMTLYVDSYIRRLRADTKLRRLFSGMGWKNNDTEFVLGDRLYRKDGVVPAGRTANTSKIIDYFKPVGELATWRSMTSVFDHPGLEAHAFTLLIGFAAPLLKLDARKGFTVALLGPTGLGKSTMGRMLASIYGHPDETWVARDSTGNAQTEHIGMYQSIPAYVDEITTIKPKDLRDLVYKIATGKGRETLRRDRTMRQSADWSTILVASTNDSLQAKLQLEKANAEAEAMRLFEFQFPDSEAFLSVAGDLHAVMNEHYGLAGSEYIRRLVIERETVKPRIRQVIEQTQQEFGMAGKERFWTQAIALALLGGELARAWGIIDFNPQVIRNWALAETRRMRGDLADSHMSATTILGNYLNEHIGERLVVSRINNAAAAHKMPVRGLSQRLELDAHELYFPRSHIKHWLSANHHNYTELKNDLFAHGVLLSLDVRKNLGAGTDLTGEQVPCWKIRTDHPELAAKLGVV